MPPTCDQNWSSPNVEFLHPFAIIYHSWDTLLYNIKMPQLVSLSCRYRYYIKTRINMRDLEKSYQSLSNTNFGLFFCKNWALFYDLFTRKSRWWFQIFFIFTPTWGRFPFLLFNSFQMGWFNHQPENHPHLLGPHDVARKAKTAFLQRSLGSFYPSAQVVEAGQVSGSVRGYSGCCWIGILINLVDNGFL